MQARYGSHRSPLATALSPAILSVVLLIAASADAASAPTVRILPASGTAQTFSVSSHFDAPSGGHFHRPGAGGAPQDESGSMVIKRTDTGNAQITLSGVADSSDATHVITGQAIDAGSPPDQYIVTFDNAAAVANGASATITSGETWAGAIQVLGQSGSMSSITINAVVASSSGGSVVIHATGKGTETFSTPRGDRTADLTIEITESLVGNRLTEFDQKISRTMQGKMGTFTSSATTTLKSS
jgi:hypothetical protein